MIFAGCCKINWPHYSQSLREENNVVKLVNSKPTFPYFGTIKMDKASHKSSNLHSLENKDQLFNINDFVSANFRDENKITSRIQNLSQNFSIENLVFSSSNTLRQSQHKTIPSITKQHKSNQSNGYSIREILRPKQASASEREKVDQRAQTTGGGQGVSGVSQDKMCEKTLFDDGCSYLNQFHTEQNNNQTESAFSIPKPSRFADNFMHNMPINSALPVEFLMVNNQNILRGERAYDLCHYRSDPEKQHIPFDPVCHQPVSPLPSHYFDEMSSSPPLASVSRCHRDRKKFQCPQCRYITDRKNNLMRHIITMHQDSGKVLECCSIAFQSKAALREHNSVFHSGGYRCQICSRNFCRKALLRRHLTVHSGQKDFFCDLCGYATSHKSNLERHQKVHSKRHNRLNLLNLSTVPFCGTDNSNTISRYINTSQTLLANQFGTATVDCDSNSERITSSPSFLHTNISSQDDNESDCDVIDVVSPNEHFSMSITECPGEKSHIPSVLKTKDTMSSHLHQLTHILQNMLKRRGFFINRIQDTYSSAFRAFSNHSYQHQKDNTKRREIKHSIKDILGEKCDTTEPNDEKNILELEGGLENSYKANSKCKIYPLLYSCPDCHREFSNQIIFDSHRCSSTYTHYDDVIAIPIVMAVRKGRLSQSNTIDLTIQCCSQKPE